jgi:hypothetical protein
MSTLQDQELLAQGQILQEEITSRTQRTSKQAQQEPEHDNLYKQSWIWPFCGGC